MLTKNKAHIPSPHAAHIEGFVLVTALLTCLVFRQFFIWHHHVAASRTTRPALWAARGVHVTIIMMTEFNTYPIAEISSLESCSSTLPSYPVWSVFGQSWGSAWAHVKSFLYFVCKSPFCKLLPNCTCNPQFTPDASPLCYGCVASVLHPASSGHLAPDCWSRRTSGN